MTWTTVLEDPEPDSAFASVEWVRDRYLAVGGADAGGHEVVRILSSLDGITWTDVATNPSVFGVTRPHQTAREWARAVAATSSGFVVVGSQFDMPAGAIWFSADGANWDRLETDGGFGGAALLTIGTSGDRVVLGGLAGIDHPFAAAWWSDDAGMTWERIDIDPSLATRDSQFRQIAIRRDTVVAVVSKPDRSEIWTLDLGGEA